MQMQTSTETDNPRKRARKNTTRACDSCKAKKTRCDGVLPCSRCQTYNHRCSYDAPHSRSHPSPIVLTPPPTAVPRATAPDIPQSTQVSREITPNATEGILGLSSNLAFSHAARVEFTSRAPSPADGGPIAGDGEPNAKAASGQDLRVATVKHLHFSEPPFPPLNLARCSLPTVEHGLEMCSWYFENASPTYRFLYRPAIEHMIRALCRSNEWLRTDQDSIELDAGDECTVLMCWALGCQYPLPPRGRDYTAREHEWIKQKGQHYYQVASLIINESQGGETLAMLHVRLLMCLYLLTTARLKAAWDLFATVKHMANSLDLTRPAIFSGSRNSELQVALRSRVFWAIYTLDTYLCAMLGKMLTFGERDIKVDHAITDDSELQSSTSYHGNAHAASHDLSLMIGPAIHAKLARIVRQALRDLYLDYNGQYNITAVRNLSAEMEQWEAGLPDIFKLSSVNGLQQIYARQAAVIRLARQHALILIYRPSLPLSSLSYQWNGSNDSALHLQDIRKHQDLCLQAAMVAAETVGSLAQKGSLSGAYWFSAYINFCAGTVMLVYLGHNMRDLAKDRRREIWRAAQSSCDTERQLASSNRLARRYVAALEALSEQLNKRMVAAERHDRENRPTTMTSPNEISFIQVPGGQYSQETQFAPMFFLGNESTSSAGTGEGFPLDDFLTDLRGPTAFFDFDSFVSGGANFGWT